VALDQDAINSAAFMYIGSELHLGITTRTEIIAHRYFGNTRDSLYSRLDFGAHSIKVALDRYFVSVAGPSGLFVSSVGADTKYIVPIPEQHDILPYFYDCASVGPGVNTDGELFAIASRTGGFSLVRISNDGTPSLVKAGLLRAGQIDLVGVVSLGSDLYPRAFVGLGKDRSLHFIKDFPQSGYADSLAFPYIPGTPYKILRYTDHLLMLTSKGLCIIPDIVREFQEDRLASGYRAVTVLEVEAVDCNVAFGRWLLIVTPEGVARLDLTVLLPPKRRVEIPEALRSRMRDVTPHYLSSESDEEEIALPVWKDTTFALAGA
jgi:hypothetical protein